MKTVIQNLKNNIQTYKGLIDDPATNDKQFAMAREQHYVCTVILDAIEAGRIVR